jgi:OpgC protein
MLADVAVIVRLTWAVAAAVRRWYRGDCGPLVDDKANLTPLRLASFLALAFTAGHLVRRNNRLLHTPVARLIIGCGQHSLHAQGRG